MKNMINSIYYIFGEIASDYYNDEYPVFLQNCRNNTDWIIYAHHLDEHPSKLLDAFCGYSNFSEISKETYELLRNIKLQQEM